MKVKFAEATGKGPTGIEDGQHEYLDCSNCQACLVDCFITRPNAIDPTTNEPFEWKLSANCPFCGDRSFTKTIHGIFHIGGYGKLINGEVDEDILSTTIDHYETDGDKFVIKVIKAGPNAKPVKR